MPRHKDMRRYITIHVFLLCLGMVAMPHPVKAQAQEGWDEESFQPNAIRTIPPSIDGFTAMVYKQAGTVACPLHAIWPEDHRLGDRRSAAVFFFGGGWKGGSPTQFEQQCRYLASRGMVAITVEYRVASRHGVKAVDCVRDAKSALRWVRSHAQTLGIDPERILAGGGSAGGHLAASLGTLPGLDESNEDSGISSNPNALALFNPALVLAPVKGQPSVSEEKQKSLADRMGVPLETLSPYHHLKADLPPCIIFHGKADTTVPFRTAALFQSKASALGATCRLVGYEGQAHGFFNYGRQGNRMFLETVRELDLFLQSLGYIEGKDTVEAFLAAANPSH